MSWAGVASGAPSTVEKSMTLSSGKSLVAGKMVSLNEANSEVGTLPTLNTWGTIRTSTFEGSYGGVNAGQETWAKNGVSLDGSRAISIPLNVATGTDGSRVQTITGYGITNGAVPAIGSTTVTIPVPNTRGEASQEAQSSTRGWAVYTTPVSNTAFMVCSIARSSNSSNNAWTWDWAAQIVTVAANGNCTVSNATTQQHTYSGTGGAGSGSGGTRSHWIPLQPFGSHATVAISYDKSESANLTQESTYNLKRFIHWNGSSLTIYKSNYMGNDFCHAVGGSSGWNCMIDNQNFISALTYQGTKRSSSAISYADGGLPLQAGIVSSGLYKFSEIPTITGVDPIVGNNYSVTITNANSREFMHGRGEENGITYIISLKSASGVLTLQGRYALKASGTYYPDGPKFIFANSMEADLSGNQLTAWRMFVGKNYIMTYPLDNTTKVPTGEQLPNAAPSSGSTGSGDNKQVLRWQGDNIIFNTKATTEADAKWENNLLTVNALSTQDINFVGFPKASTSSSPAIVVVNGIATGFSGLTRGAIYCTSTEYNGNIVPYLTTYSENTKVVGKAISATELLIDREI